MKNLNYFDRSPQGDWLQKLFEQGRLKVGEQVCVNGQVYRYSQEKQGLEHVLIPVEGRK